jgi:hypothetical protein
MYKVLAAVATAVFYCASVSSPEFYHSGLEKFSNLNGSLLKPNKYVSTTILFLFFYNRFSTAIGINKRKENEEAN